MFRVGAADSLESPPSLSRCVYARTRSGGGELSWADIAEADGEWARFVLSQEGQAIVLDQGIFLPLSGNILRQAEA